MPRKTREDAAILAASSLFSGAGVGVGVGGTRRFALLNFTLCCQFHPISLVLPKETGWSPKERRLGWWRPRKVSGPTRLSHSRGSCHSAAKVSASRTDCITRPRGEGLGLDVDWRLKVFCPAFLQKSGRGPGAAPLAARRSARNSLVLTKRRRGLKGEPSPGVPPLRAAEPPAAYAHRRNAGGGRRKGSSRTPTPTAGGKPPVCRVIYCEIITRPGRGWRNVVRLAETVTAGRRGRRPLQGWCSSRVRAKNAKFPCRGGAPAPSRVGFRGLRRILG